MPAVTTMQRTALPPLEWADTPEACAALAAGAVLHPEVAHWEALAQRVEHAHASGRIVLHHWAPLQANQANAQAPVVLLHGGSGSWTHWVRSIGPLLAAGHDVWAVDLPGFGDSDAPEGVEDADTMIAPLAQMMEAQFPLQAVQLVGFSFGAMTGAMLAAAHPHLVAQLVITGAPGFGLQSARPYHLKGWRHLKTPYAQLQHHVYNLGQLMLRHPESITRDTVALHAANVQRDRLPRRRISRTGVVVEALGRMTCPVTAIYGEHDALYPDLMDEVEQLLRTHAVQFRGMHRIADAGHWVQYERPDATNAVLLAALAGQAAA